MSALPIVIAALLGAAPVQFQRHLIDNFPAGYQIAVTGLIERVSYTNSSARSRASRRIFSPVTNLASAS